MTNAKPNETRKTIFQPRQTRSARPSKGPPRPTKTPRKRRTKQFSFLPSAKDSLGSMKCGTHAKTKRPLESKKPLHVCVRSSQAKGLFTFQGRNRVKVDGLVDRTSKKMGVRVSKYANNGNHLHLVVKLPGRGGTARAQYAKWIRALTGLIAFEMRPSATQQEFEPSSHKKPAEASANKVETVRQSSFRDRSRFWDTRPFTRVIRGRSGFRIIDRYVLKNHFEADGWPKDVAILMARDHFESAHAPTLPKWKPPPRCNRVEPPP